MTTFNSFKNKLINESVKATELRKLMSSTDFETKKIIKNLYKEDNIALSELTDNEVQVVTVWHQTELRQILRKGAEALRRHGRRPFPMDRRIFHLDQQENKILLSVKYDQENDSFSIDYTTDPKAKNLKQYFENNVEDIPYKDNIWVVIDLPSRFDVRNIKAADVQKELDHIWKREVASLRKEITEDDTKIKNQIIEKIKEITDSKNLDLTGSYINKDSAEIRLKEFGHNLNYYLRTTSNRYQVDPEEGVKSINLELNMGSMGSINPKELPNYVKVHGMYYDLGMAVINNDKEISELIQLHFDLINNSRKFDRFTFEVDGKLFKKTSTGYEEIQESINEDLTVTDVIKDIESKEWKNRLLKIGIEYKILGDDESFEVLFKTNKGWLIGLSIDTTKNIIELDPIEFSSSKGYGIITGQEMLYEYIKGVLKLKDKK